MGIEGAEPIKIHYLNLSLRIVFTKQSTHRFNHFWIVAMRNRHLTTLVAMLEHFFYGCFHSPLAPLRLSPNLNLTFRCTNPNQANA